MSKFLLEPKAQENKTKEIASLLKNVEFIYFLPKPHTVFRLGLLEILSGMLWDISMSLFVTVKFNF